MISPLLANLYLHWFDKLFHRPDGPYRWANARLVRYADDFVILARHVGGRIEGFVEQTLQGRVAAQFSTLLIVAGNGRGARGLAWREGNHKRWPAA